MRLITHRGVGILRRELRKVSQCVYYQPRAPAQTKMASILLRLKKCQRQFKNRRKSQPGQFLSDCGNLQAWKDFRNRTFNRVDKEDHILRKKSFQVSQRQEVTRRSALQRLQRLRGQGREEGSVTFTELNGAEILNTSWQTQERENRLWRDNALLKQKRRNPGVLSAEEQGRYHPYWLRNC